MSAARALVLPSVEQADAAPHKFAKEKSVGVSLLKQREEKKAARASAKKSMAVADALVAREDILASLYAMLAKEEAPARATRRGRVAVLST